MSEIIFRDIPPHFENQLVGLFGGSFNPPHEGHLLVAKYALTSLAIDKLWWMVTPGNPLKNNEGLPDTEFRIEQSYQLVKNINNIYVTDFEKAILSSTSFDTIKYLKQHTKLKLILIIGEDCLADFHHWYNWQAIANEIAILVVNRPGYLTAHKDSVFAKTYAKNKTNDLKNLINMKKPVWAYIEGKQSDLSSNRLRDLLKNSNVD